MKIVCTKKNLHQGLSVASRVIGSGNTLPVLNNILFKTESGRLKLSSTNLEVAINIWVGGRIEEEGELTVPARLINDYVNNLSTDQITITSQDQTMFLEGERAKTHIKGLPSEEFPLIPRVEEDVYAKLKSEKLSQAVREVVFAASYSETQPEISGILFNFEGKVLTLAATDRYRLAEESVELSGEVSNARQIIIPARAVNEVGRLLSGGDVEIYLSEGQICFRTEGTELVSRLIEGNYPDYKQIIPKNFTTEAVLNRVDLIQSLKAASLFASDNNNIEFDITPQNKQVVIHSQSAQTGDSEIALPGQLSGQKNSIIFNFRYLLECLSNLQDEKVTLKVIDAGSPAQIVPSARENYLYLVMPIKI